MATAHSGVPAPERSRKQPSNGMRYLWGIGMQPKAIETLPFRPITEFILMGLFIAWAVLFVNTIRAGEDSCPLKSEADTAVYYVSKAY